MDRTGLLEVRLHVGVPLAGSTPIVLLGYGLDSPPLRMPRPFGPLRTFVSVSDPAEDLRRLALEGRDLVEEQGGAPPEVIVRFRVSAQRLQERDLPWPSILATMSQHAVVVVDRPRPKHVKQPALELPLRVSTDVASPEEGPSSPRELLFDDFTRGVEGIAWRLVDRAERPHIFHCGTMDRRTVPERATVAAQLVVAHVMPGTEADETASAIREVARSLAVLVVTSRPETARAFFNGFYRKMMHDQPLDRAAWIAMNEAGLGTDAVRLDLAAGAEDALRLRHAAEDPIASLLHEAAPTRPVSRRPVKLLGSKATLEVRASRDLLAPVQASPGPPTRLTQHLTRRLTSQATQLLRNAAEIQQRIHALDFAHEDIGVREALQLHLTAVDLRARHDDLNRAVTAMTKGVSAERAEAAERRYANLWVRDRDRITVAPSHGLEVGRAYELVFAVMREMVAGGAAADVWDRDLALYFADRDWIDVDVLFFAPPGELTIEPRSHPLRVPRWGDSQEITAAMTPRRAGPRTVRAAMYYRGQLLQSVVLRTAVVDPGNPVTQEVLDLLTKVTGAPDYLASVDFDELDRLPSPGLSLLVNDVDATHWVGVYTPTGAPVAGLERGQLFTVPEETFNAHAGAIRKAMAEVEGLTRTPASYNFAGTPIGTRAALLVDLARAGRRLYASLFEDGVGTAPNQNQLNDFSSAVRPGNRVLSIGRCREGTTIPWAAAYDLFVDPADPALELCGNFRAQLAAGNDLVEHPDQCAAQASCPLRTPAAARTVCPFGFWGFRHEIEQPLGSVTVGTDSRVVRPRIATRIAWDGGKPLVGLGAYQFAELAAHVNEVGQVVDIDGPKLAREDVLTMLGAGTKSIYYFFCHGDYDGAFLKLRVGTSASAGVIESASLNVSNPAIRTAWHEHTPLVFFNGCDTVAFEAHALSEFVTRFRKLEASGIIGTEVAVFAALATDVGRNILGRIARGQTLGVAMLGMRQDLLRALNPLGLAYVAYASSGLHLHTAGCRCENQEAG
jgi:hypothetical protein